MANSKVLSEPTYRIGVFHLAATVSVAAAVIFVLCWLGTFVRFTRPAHAYIGLFTLADIRSGVALIEGILSSLLVGGLSGGLVATFYNLFSGLRR